METRKIKTPLTDEIIASLHAGDMVLLSGEVYTARDVAHRRLYEALLKGEKLPINLSQTVLFYAARSAKKDHRFHRPHDELPDGFFHSEINRKWTSRHDRQG